MTSPQTRHKRKLAVAVAEARLAGVHPDWIRWILEQGEEDQLAMLRTVTAHVDMYSKPMHPKIPKKVDLYDRS